MMVLSLLFGVAFGFAGAEEQYKAMKACVRQIYALHGVKEIDETRYLTRRGNGDESKLKVREVARGKSGILVDRFVEYGTYWRHPKTGSELVFFFGDTGTGAAVPEFEIENLKWKAKHHGTTRRLFRIKPTHGTDSGYSCFEVEMTHDLVFSITRVVRDGVKSDCRAHDGITTPAEAFAPRPTAAHELLSIGLIENAKWFAGEYNMPVKMVPSTAAKVEAEQFKAIENDVELMREVCDPEQLRVASKRLNKMHEVFQALTMNDCSPYKPLPKHVRKTLDEAGNEIDRSLAEFDRYLPKLVMLCMKAGIDVPADLRKLCK